MWALLIRWLSYLSWLFMSVDGSIAYLSVHVESLGKLFCPHEVVTLSLEPLGLLLVHGRGRALLLHLGTQKHYITYLLKSYCLSTTSTKVDPYYEGCKGSKWKRIE